MTTTRLIDTAHALVASGKGLLAMDESIGTCNLRLAAAGVAQTLPMRHAWRELLVTAPGLGTFISGVIVVDETLRQESARGLPFAELAQAAGLRVGIKVDLGAKALAAHPGEMVTEGLDGLRERLLVHAALGASFAKWRAVFDISDAGLPSRGCIDANAHALARYAALCQEAGLVPIIEPEVLMTGTHTQERCAEVTEAVLRSVFAHLAAQQVVLEALILKPNMVIAGTGCATQHRAEDVADATLACLLRVVPAAVPGIAFLSGGQSGEDASRRLNAMHRRGGAHTARTGRAPPWPLTFSFARALQHPALEIWAGAEANRPAAQQALLHRARCNQAALQGEYSASMEAA